MKKAYKTFLGLYSKTRNKNKYTHVILSLKEYKNLINDLNNLKYENKKMLENIESNIKIIKNKYDNIIEENNQSNKLKIQTLMSEVENIKLDNIKLNKQNGNLIRIMKERANSKRNLKPKKKHHGYLIISSEKYEYTYNNIKLNFWKVIIQSPYDIYMDYNIISEIIKNEIKDIMYNYFNVIYIEEILFKNSINGIMKICIEKDNFVFKYDYKQNFDTSYWEVEYFIKSNQLNFKNIEI